MTALVLIVILITKFTQGAWISLAAMAAIYALMTAIRRHYQRVSDELHDDDDDTPSVLPSRNHVIVLVSKLHRPTKRALAYARAMRPDLLEAVTVNVDDHDTRELVDHWNKQPFSVPLKVIESPYREITKPVLDAAKLPRRESLWSDSLTYRSFAAPCPATHRLIRAHPQNDLETTVGHSPSAR